METSVAALEMKFHLSGSKLNFFFFIQKSVRVLCNGVEKLFGLKFTTVSICNQY